MNRIRLSGFKRCFNFPDLSFPKMEISILVRRYKLLSHSNSYAYKGLCNGGIYIPTVEVVQNATASLHLSQLLSLFFS